jgi:hypothetical protein
MDQFDRQRVLELRQEIASLQRENGRTDRKSTTVRQNPIQTS